MYKNKIYITKNSCGHSKENDNDDNKFLFLRSFYLSQGSRFHLALGETLFKFYKKYNSMLFTNPIEDC